MIPNHIKYILKVYLLSILCFGFFRFLLFLVEYHQLNSIPSGKFGIIIQAFLMGLRFDTVISGYILSLPLIFFTMAAILHLRNPLVFHIANAFTGLLYSVSFVLCAIDIPFFRQFFSRLTTSALAWAGTPVFVLKMIFEEVRYWIWLIPLLFILFVFWVILDFIKRKSFFRKNKRQNLRPDRGDVLRIGVFSILLMGLMFLGIRGRLAEKSPIRVGTAYFCAYAFPNQLGLNPVFTFIRSWMDDRKPENANMHLMDPGRAVIYARNYLNINENNTSPIARRVICPDSGNKRMQSPNVVIVIMESMSGALMERFGNPDKLTPCLDSLARKGISFDNTYTAGIHTYNGIFSTLFSLPALLKQQPMNHLPTTKCSGISNTLKKYGYQTVFFMTHDDQFDNTGGFLTANAFDEIIAQKDYPSSKVLSTLGVPDHYMFEFSINKLNDLAKNNKPFLAGFMTASDHGPYIIPEGIDFHPYNKDHLKAEVEYADWSIRHFLELASKQTWFNNTLFVFVADHGIDEGGVYDMPLNYHHSPFIMYAPSIIKPGRIVSGMGGQIDVFPTVMGLLNLSYTNNTLGVDLLKEQRPCIYFSADDKIGCIDREFYYVYRTQGEPSLYRYKNRDTKNYLADFPSRADSLRNYAFSMIQTAQFMLTKGLNGNQK